MNIALIGYGRMGHEVETAARSRSHTIVATFDIDSRLTATALQGCGADVAIDFTLPDSVLSSVQITADAGIPIVIGTTGWESEQSSVEEIILATRTACVYASNFSIGVNLFLQIVSEASKQLNCAGYDVYISEAHHNRKKDFPSGTALRIADAVIAQFESKTHVQSVLTQGQAPAPNELLISSIRAGAIMGTHTVGFDNEVDQIELTHRAKSRSGFALGAVRAAEWIVGKHGIFRFEDHISEILNTTA